MSVFINPGSRIVQTDSEPTWTNTFEQAKKEAENWLETMRKEGIVDVAIVNWDETEYEGRWRFEFEHAVTRVRVTLETHGIDNLTAYRKRAIFDPKVYWNGSSCANPSHEDFAAEGFKLTFVEEVSQ